MTLRIKYLRSAVNMTQAGLAKMLGVTQQTVSRWEEGKSEPNIAALRDLAMVFGCSVGDLLEIGEQYRPRSSRLHWTSRAVDGFWGHFGVRLDGDDHTRWFPVSGDEAKRIRYRVSSYGQERWITVWTLNNRVLFVNTDNICRVLLLDDDCDESEDWDNEDQELGFSVPEPPELYRGLDAWLDSAHAPAGWESETSERFRSVVLGFIEENNLNYDSVQALLYFTRIYYANGHRLSCWADEKYQYDLYESAEYESVGKYVELHTLNGEEYFIPAEKLAMIDVPQLQLIDEIKRIESEIKKESGEGPAIS